MTDTQSNSADPRNRDSTLNSTLSWLSGTFSNAAEDVEYVATAVVQEINEQTTRLTNTLRRQFTYATDMASDLLGDIAGATVGLYRYALGGNGQNGTIDCSNYTRMCVDRMTNQLRSDGVIDARTEQAIDSLFYTTSEGQLVNMMRYGTRISENQLLNGGLQEGMMLFMDTGTTSFDAGRQYGTDHVAFTYRDENGRLMVAESRGGRGTTISDAESYVERMANRGNITAVSIGEVVTNVAANHGIQLGR